LGGIVTADVFLIPLSPIIVIPANVVLVLIGMAVALEDHRDKILAFTALGTLTFGIVMLFIYLSWIIIFIVFGVIIYLGILAYFEDAREGIVIITVFAALTAGYITLFIYFHTEILSVTILILFFAFTVRNIQSDNYLFYGSTAVIFSLTYFYLYTLYPETMQYVSIPVAIIIILLFIYRDEPEKFFIFAIIIAVIGGLLTLIVFLYIKFPIVCLIVTCVIVYFGLLLIYKENWSLIVGLTLIIGFLTGFAYLFILFYYEMIIVTISIVYLILLFFDTSRMPVLKLSIFGGIIALSYYLQTTYYFTFLTFVVWIIYEFMLAQDLKT
jgi:hypothetical protein